MKKLAIIGTRSFSHTIAHYATETNEFEFVGYFDDIEPQGTIINGYPVLGKVDEAENAYKKGVFDEIFIGVGYTRFDLREQYFNSLKGKIPFANIIMPDAKIDSTVKLGEGVFVGSGTTIYMDTVIEDNVFLRGSNYIGHDNVIKSHTYVSGRLNTAGHCIVGERCFLGVCACVKDHTEICDDVWVGIGSLVLKDITVPGKYMPIAKLVKVD